MPVVQLDDVVVLLGRFPALAGLSLSIDAGEVVVLQGPNGAGKTTLLRLCAGLARIESGRGEVLGFDLEHEAPEIRRRVGLVGPTGGLYRDLTVEENIRFWARASAVDKSTGEKIDESVGHALDRLGIEDRVTGLAVHKLSTGQRRRASIATMVVRRPQLWLLDEPHAGLDQTGRDLVDSLVNDAVAAGATVLLASHELERVQRIATRAITVAGGGVHADTRDPVVGGPAGGDDAG